jgi:hypothetical protein
LARVGQVTSSRGRAAGAVLLLAGLYVVARGALHAATFRLPVSNDDAIPLLMARAVLRGEIATTLWNQPYNGALDAYLLAPLVAAFGSHLAFRLYEIGCALALVAACAALAGRAAGPLAATAAGAFAAFGTPYMALMAATGPTPNFLVPLLVAGVLLLVDGPSLTVRHALVAGLIAGLAVWDSALALPSLAGVLAGLLARGWRPLPGPALAALLAAAMGLLPWIAARVSGAQGSSTVTAIRPLRLLAAGVADLARATGGLLGLEVPLVVDGPERAVLPLVARALLGGALLAAMALGLRRATWPLVGWALGLAAAFALSRRTGGDEIRYLYGLVVPVLAVAGCGIARLCDRRAPALLLAAGLLGPWGLGHREVWRAWRDPSHAARVWQVPSLEPVRETLRRAGVQSAYASLQFAGRLTLETDGAVIASQAWNERIPGDPLRFRDEVDLDPRAAWVLSPHLSRGMPRAAGFRALLREAGGTAHEDLAGDLVVFRSFRPPYDEGASIPAASWLAQTESGVPLGPAATDRDGSTRWTSAAGLAPGLGLKVRLATPQPLGALVLLVDLEESPLAVPWVAAVDGETVGQGPAAHGLQWVGGVPRAARQAALAIPLAGRVGREVSLVFQGRGPRLVVGEVFLYGTAPAGAADPGAARAAEALERARAGDWGAAVDLYRQAVSLAPERAGHHAALARARWRAGHRLRVDVESVTDGGEELVGRR